MAKNNIVTFGLRNVHYSLASTVDGETWTYATPVALPGAQEFSSQLIGGTTNVNADDTIVHQLVSNSGRTITLTLTELTDEFKKNILGYKETTEGNLVEITNAAPVTFALGFEIQGDVKARRVWYFLCTATPVS
jgi:phi13 family phage major tail protein